MKPIMTFDDLYHEMNRMQGITMRLAAMHRSNPTRFNLKPEFEKLMKQMDGLLDAEMLQNNVDQEARRNRANITVITGDLKPL